MLTLQQLALQVHRRLDLVLITVLLIAGAFLGGSSLQKLDGHLTLQFCASLALMVGVVADRPVPVGRAVATALAILLVWIGYATLQLVPLPAELMPGSPRQVVFRAWSFLGNSQTRLGISLSPSETIGAILASLPPLAVFILLATARWQTTTQPACWLLTILGATSSLLGLGQLFSGPDSPLYRFPGSGTPLGVFSNPNHQASFLIIVLPIALALLIEHRRNMRSGDGEFGLLLAAAALVVALVVGVITAGSGAGYILFAAVTPLCALLFLSPKSTQSRALLPVIFFCVAIFAVLGSLSSPLLPEFTWASQDGETARPAVWSKSLSIASEHFPYGTGLGSFPYVYPLYESPENVSASYVNAAHNEYVHVYLEMGLPGLIVILAALVLWCLLSIRVWTARIDGEIRLRRAASIALLVVILHSLIDYPLRAPFYAMVAAMCLAVLSAPDREFRRQAQTNRDSLAEKANDRRISI